MDSARSSPTQQATRTAADEAGNVASTAAERTQDVAGTAKEQLGEVAQDASAQVRTVVDDSKARLHDRARSQTDQMASTLRELGDQINALLEGRTADAGPVADYARQAASSVSRFAGDIEQKGFDGIIDDVERFARRRPGAFLLGAAVAGFGVGRILRSASTSQDSLPDGSHGLAPNGHAGMTQQLPAPTASAIGTGYYEAEPELLHEPPLTHVDDGTVAGMTSAPQHDSSDELDVRRAP